MEQSGQGASTLLDRFAAQVERHPEATALRHIQPAPASGAVPRTGSTGASARTPASDERVVATSWSEWQRRARVFAAALARLGVEPGDRVAILAHTRMEWACLDLATMMAGAVSVPIFPTETAQGCVDLLRDSGARVVVVEDPHQTAKLVGVRERLDTVEQVVAIDAEARDRIGHVQRLEDVAGEAKRDGWLLEFERFRDLGEGGLEELRGELDRRADRAAPDDPVTVHYTPGTEGFQKGVVLTHRNFLATTASLADVLPISPDDEQVLYLPLAQAFARISLMVAVEVGFVTSFARSYRTVLEDCRVFRPTFLCGVPRLFEKVQSRLEAQRRELPALQRLGLRWGLRLAARDSEGSRPRSLPLRVAQRRVADRAIYRSMRSLFGERLRFAISGGAGLHEETGRFFRHHGLEILQGYGLTETCGCTHINRLGENRLGTVGRPLPCVSWRLLEDGELLVRGPNVTPGFRGRPEATRRVFDEEGWLHTGDLVRVDEDGFFTITDRKRDVIVTASGKPIAPGPISEALRSDPLIARALIHGEHRNFLTALIALEPDTLRAFARERGLEGTHGELARRPEVYAAVDRIVERVNATLPSQERIRKFAILTDEQLDEEPGLAPSQAGRRRVASERHRALLDSFYEEQY